MSIEFKGLFIPMACGIGWGVAAWVGLGSERNFEMDRGFVMISRVTYDILFPLLAMVLSLVPAALVSQTKYWYLGNYWCGFFIFALLVYFAILLISNGGFV